MIYLFLADGFEDIEALAPLDILRRGGVEVKTVGVGGKIITSSKGVKMEADILESEVNYSDMEGVILPGGIPGTPNLKASSAVCDAVLEAYDNGKIVCAICAAPSILAEMGLLKGKKATCYPSFADVLGVDVYTGDAVTRSENIITGQGAGVCLDFGFEILKALKGEESANEVARSMMCR